MANPLRPHRFLSIILLYIASSNSLIASPKAIHRLSPLSAKQIVIFGPNNLRVHDNPCLLYNEGKPIIPVIFSPFEGIQQQEAVSNLRIKLTQMGGSPIEFSNKSGDAVEDFARFLKSIQSDSEDIVTVTYCKAAVEPAASAISYLIRQTADMSSNVQCIGLWDEIINLNPDEVACPNLHFDEFTEQYKGYSLVVPKPVMQPKILFEKLATESVEVEISKSVPTKSLGEDRGLQLLTEYLNIGDKAFSFKYASTYAADFSTSKSHTESLARLSSIYTEKGEKTDTVGTNFFQGEVLSALLAPLLTMGCLSPRLLIHARSILLGKEGNFLVNKEFPFVNRIREEAVRRDWHQQLARAGPVKDLDEQVDIINESKGVWDTKYHNWRGYIQREGAMRLPSPLTSGDNRIKSSIEIKEKPLAFILHGMQYKSSYT